MLSALIAFHTSSEVHSRARPPPVSSLSLSPLVVFGRFRRKKLVLRLAFGAIA